MNSWMIICIIFSFRMIRYTSGIPAICCVKHYQAKNGVSSSCLSLLSCRICLRSIQNLEVIGPTVNLSISENEKDDKDFSSLYYWYWFTSKSINSSFSISSFFTASGNSLSSCSLLRIIDAKRQPFLFLSYIKWSNIIYYFYSAYFLF